MTDTAYIAKYTEVLQASALFRGLTEAELVRAAGIFRAEYAAYEKGGFLHPPYTEMKRFGLVLSGAVQACMDDVEGNRMIMAEVVPGVTFGEALCFLRQKDCPVYICASAPAEVLWFSVDALFRDSPDAFTIELQRQFTAMLAARTLAMNDRIQVLSKLKLRDKLICYFSQLSQSQKGNTILLPMSRSDLAAYLGADRSALSRELSRLKNEGMIEYRGRQVKLLKAE